jgi:exopolysaccharide biosynthesis WecB/TagA/CpsF family protein
LQYLHACIAARSFTPVTFLNAHNANVAASDAEFRKALDGFLIFADGIGVDIAAKLLYGRPFRDNLNGTDFVPAVLAGSPVPLKVGLFGARPGVAQAATRAFAEIDDRHEYQVISHGFLRDGDEEYILHRLKDWRPDILLVALGVPRQELWIAEKLNSLHCTVPMGVGALFDLTTGTVPRAPPWMRELRCEWVYRLIQEPQRLARRYLVGNPLFLYRVMRARLAGKAA